ncbi:hypothetical protein NL676_003665 [Syzygium grande]|nr:hypothetical protein NL676_003665 [Syzygium grande]
MVLSRPKPYICRSMGQSPNQLSLRTNHGLTIESIPPVGPAPCSVPMGSRRTTMFRRGGRGYKIGKRRSRIRSIQHLLPSSESLPPLPRIVRGFGSWDRSLDPLGRH